MAASYDLVVIGAGPGGYVAAARASALGLKTAIVEKDKSLGGTCLLRGCIPTKALLHAADVYGEIQEASKIGITTTGVKVEWDKIQKTKERIISTNAGGVSHLMKSRNVDVYEGFAQLKGSKQVVVTKGDKSKVTLDATRILLCVGSKPRGLPFAPIAKRVLSSDEILSLESIPGSLVVVGGGVIGIEFASLFARFGTKVTVVEALPRILAAADEECSKELAYQLEQQGVQFYVNAQVKEITNKKSSTQTTFVTEKGENVVVDADYVLVSVGRAPLTEGIGLETTQVKTTRGFIDVNGMMQTQEPNIYAIGDCVNTPWLAHVASMEGMIAVEHMAGKKPAPFNYDHTPSCVYSEPAVAWSGLTEAEAKKRGYDVKVSKFDFMRNGKASILGKKRGFVKFVTDARYGEILGVHIVGPQATELIAEPAFAMQMEATIDDVAHVMHAHPTLYESIYEAALTATGRGVHG